MAALSSNGLEEDFEVPGRLDNRRIGSRTGETIGREEPISLLCDHPRHALHLPHHQPDPSIRISLSQLISALASPTNDNFCRSNALRKQEQDLNSSSVPLDHSPFFQSMPAPRQVLTHEAH